MIAAEAVQEEAGLVKQARAGDGDAFGSLYLLHLDAIFRYIYFRIGDQREAEDLTEQVFLKAWEALPGYKDFGYPFASWLYRIAHNLVIDYIRRVKPVSSVSIENQDGNDCGSAVIQQILETEETGLLAAAIIRLPEEQQQVIILRFIEGMSHAGVARILNKSEGACRMIQNRALIALSQMLSGPEG